MTGPWLRRVVIVTMGLALAYLWGAVAYRETVHPELRFDPVEIACPEGEGLELCRERALAKHERDLRVAYLITFGPPLAAFALAALYAWRRRRVRTHENG